jgi:predicted dehydrogenase
VQIERILIIGHGSIGKRHLRLGRELFPRANIQVLRHGGCDGVPEYASGCLVTLQNAIAFSPQIAIIANPAPLHLGVALPLVRAGVHVLIEKPIGVSSEGIEELESMCHARRVICLTGYNLRFQPSLLRFKALIESNSIGDVLSVRCETGQYLPSWRPEADYRMSVSARKCLGGGVLLELSHELDYLRWIFGEVEWVRATLRRQSNLDIDVEDTAHLLLGFAKKSGDRQLIASLNMDFVRHDATRVCTAIGDKGSLRWNALEGNIELFSPGSQGWREVFRQLPENDASYRAEWQHFLSCIAGQSRASVSVRDGLEVIRIIDAARRSDSGGATARVNR